MSISIHTTGTHTITRPDGSVSSVAFESTRTVGEVPPEVPVPIPPEEIVDPPDPLPSGALLVVIEINEPRGTYYFNQEDGTDLGDYVDPQGRFVQHCIRVTNDELPGFSVMFRPDADGSRQEIVFELGHIWPAQPAANLGAYEANIVPENDDSAEMIVIDVPHHNWFGRWRWQSAPRPVVAQVADLIAAGLLPHYDASVGGGFTQPSSPQHYAGPMDLAGITANMPQTGERDDIGMVTECQGDYLCTCSPTALSSLLAQLEGSGTLTWHYRDETTGAPLDTFTYPRASSFNQWESDPYIPWKVGDGGGIDLDTSHEPDLGYVPFLLTGDPYALEEMQFTVTYNVIKDNPAYRDSYNMAGALRAHAWALRTMARCAKVTPASVPQWLLPQAYFRRLLDGNRDFVARDYATSGVDPYVGLSVMSNGAGAPAESNIPADCADAPWWEDFEQAVQGHIVEMGFDDWRPNYEWKARNIVDRCSGVSGWNRCYAFLYKMAVRETGTAPHVADWAECWDLNCALGVCDAAADDAHLLESAGTGYPSYGLAALAIASRLNIAGAAEAHAWLRAEMNARLAPNATINARWSIA